MERLPFRSPKNKWRGQRDCSASCPYWRPRLHQGFLAGRPTSHQPDLRAVRSSVQQSRSPGALRTLFATLACVHAALTGPEDTPYVGGDFRLEIEVPERYPFEPPHCRFVTPVYHPNIDSAGRICLDTLKLPPSGDWKPSVNLPTLLSMIRLLLAHPNPDDGLVADVTEQFVSDRAAFDATARNWTRRHAQNDSEEPQRKRQKLTDDDDDAVKDSASDEKTAAPSREPSSDKETDRIVQQKDSEEGRGAGAAEAFSPASGSSSDEDDE